MSADTIERAVLDAARIRLETSAAKIVHCLSQIDDSQVWWRPTPNQNSIGNLILHLCGNVGQWIISGVGGAADVRDRPSEFSQKNRQPKSELLTMLHACIEQSGEALSTTDPSRLLSDCRIQGFDTTMLSAILDTVSHFQGHTQEIISLTRQQTGNKYQFHFVPSTPDQISARSE